MQTALQTLQHYYGYSEFRPQQAEIISSVEQGHDALVIMPTGGGKSLCYQIPALLRQGVGLVVSPLIALMHDQVTALKANGIKAAYLNSQLSAQESFEVTRQLRNGELQLLYIAPERLLTGDTLAMLQQIPLSLIAIDEAHCVSQWGHDFRPEYMKLNQLAQAFPNVPRMALTATADDRTQDEIVQNLQLNNPARFVTGFDRPNIRYHISSGSNAKDRLLTFLDTHHAGDAGIVYCLSRNAVEKTAFWLMEKGRKAIFYHAGMDAADRREAQDRFLKEDGLIVVATIAFGMGIDKPDVRFVAHLNLPKSVEAYYQETGRAGRDGADANAWLNYDLSDVVKLSQWIEQSQAPDIQKRVERHKLDALLGLCEITSCRRQALLGYFGEQDKQPCGNCDNCLEPPETYDGLEVSQKALSCVYRTGQRFGAAHVIDVLRGSGSERIKKFQHDQLAVFGKGDSLDAKQWRGVFRQLTARGFLQADFEAYGALKLTAKSRPLLLGEEGIQLRREITSSGTKKSKKSAASGLNGATEKLFNVLRELRKSLAEENGVPPYVIFHDSTLLEMAKYRPDSLAALSNISGVGDKKLEQYGAEFVAAIEANPAQAEDALTETVASTFALHQEGMAIEDIAAKRRVGVPTVYDHLADCMAAGLLQLSDVVELDQEQLNTILAAMTDHINPIQPKLRPVFEALDKQYDYGLLRCALVHWEQQGKG